MKIKGKPKLINNADGGLEIFVMSMSDSSIWHWSQNYGIANVWMKVGTMNNLWHFTVSRNIDGTLEVFAEDWYQQCWHIKQQSPGNEWLKWEVLADLTTEYSAKAHQICAPLNQDGRLEIISLHDSLSLYHLNQAVPNNSWGTAFSKLALTTGGSGLRRIEVIKDVEGCLNIFGLTEDYALVQAKQIAPGLWEPIHLPHPLTNPKPNVSEKPHSFSHSKGPTSEIIAEAHPGFSSIEAEKIPHPPGQTPNFLNNEDPTVKWEEIVTNAGDFRAWLHKDGRFHLFWLRGGSIYHCFQQMPNSDWSTPYGLPQLQGVFGGELFSQLEVCERIDGCLEVVALLQGNRDPNGFIDTLYHIWQTMPNGEWSDWERAGGAVVREFSIGYLKNGDMEVIIHSSDYGIYSFTLTNCGGAHTGGPNIPRFLPGLISFITDTNLPAAWVNEEYNIQIQTTSSSAPFTWKLLNNNLQSSGLSFNTSTGILSGVPSQNGGFYLVVEFIDASNQSIQNIFNLIINPLRAPVIKTVSLHDAIIAINYSAVLEAQYGLPPYIWGLRSGDSLPIGLSLGTSSGIINGKPNAVGLKNFTITCTGGGITSEKNLSINVIASAPVTPPEMKHDHVELVHTGEETQGFLQYAYKFTDYQHGFLQKIEYPKDNTTLLVPYIDVAANPFMYENIEIRLNRGDATDDMVSLYNVEQPSFDGLIIAAYIQAGVGTQSVPVIIYYTDDRL